MPECCGLCSRAGPVYGVGDVSTAPRPFTRGTTFLKPPLEFRADVGLEDGEELVLRARLAKNRPIANECLGIQNRPFDKVSSSPCCVVCTVLTQVFVMAVPNNIAPFHELREQITNERIRDDARVHLTNS